jgi:hypothetical protein
MNETKRQDEAMTESDLSTNPAPRPVLANRFVLLSVLWMAPSLGAIWILCTQPADWLGEHSFGQRLQTVRFEQWIALTVVMLHPFWIWKAIASYRKKR